MLTAKLGYETMAKSSQIFLCFVIQTFMDQESKFENGLIGRDQVSGLQEEGVAFRDFTLVLQQRIFEYKRSRKRISTLENYFNLLFNLHTERIP